MGAAGWARTATSLSQLKLGLSLHRWLVGLLFPVACIAVLLVGSPAHFNKFPDTSEFRDALHLS